MKQAHSEKQLREFGLIIGIGFPLIIGFLLPLISGHSFRSWTLFIGLPCLISSIAFPKILYYPYIGWMRLGHILGFINSRIILGLVFLLVLQPIALIMKLCGYDPLRKKKMNTLTYREIKDTPPTDLTRIF